jgi:FAD/FMN-containing dehydrogenase
MQSNDGFSVGGSVSVNCHGWQPNRPPIASTVESIRVVRPDGAAVTCSRTEDGDLFSHVLGGYGLFGVVIELRLRVTENAMYVARRIPTTPEGYAAALREYGSRAGLAFGRLSIHPEHLFDEAFLTVYEIDPTFAGSLPSASDFERGRLERLLFRGEVGSDYGKKLRWMLEKVFGSEGGKRATRNQLMSEPVGVFQNRRSDRTDLLHEYFVPAEAFASFVADARRVILEHRADLLNATVRNVLEDRDTRLRYAPTDVLSLVLLFSLARTANADERMRSMTRELCEVCLAHAGRHYLPYRLHATKEQVLRGYPMLEAVLAKKRELDPDLLLRNAFYDYVA